jgi:hypothetical protein
VLAEGANVQVSQTAEKAFNVILPVLAGWVGTVLAFYFSAASQERTAQSLDRAIRQAGGTGPGTLVSEKMIPTGSILELKQLDNDQHKPDSYNLDSLRDIFTKPRGDGIAITRLVFVENQVFRYVLHSKEEDGQERTDNDHARQPVAPKQRGPASGLVRSRRGRSAGRSTHANLPRVGMVMLN